jgi:hypothetical protein
MVIVNCLKPEIKAQKAYSSVVRPSMKSFGGFWRGGRCAVACPQQGTDFKSGHSLVPKAGDMARRLPTSSSLEAIALESSAASGTLGIIPVKAHACELISQLEKNL